MKEREESGCMRDNMKVGIRKCIALCLAGAVAMSMAGCEKTKKEPKPAPKATVKVDEGNTNADGRGEGQADVPLVAGTGTFSKKFNPFLAETKADRQAVDLTQVKLVTNDRTGKIVYHGIDGELRKYNDENYTYYGASDLSIQYDEKKDSTVYHIQIRDDLSFSDGEKLTIDDVIFSLYVFCDVSYSGTATLKEMPIKGLLNYQTNSTKAESYTEKGLVKQMKKHREKFRKWLKKQGYSALAEKLRQGAISEKKLLRKNLSGNQELFRQARIYFSRGKGKKVNHISGIRKLNDYELSIETTGYQRRMSAALQIPICALHYYGDLTKYNLEKNHFGFRRGDISSVLANKSTPMGAGAYRFVKYEEGVVYFTSNELYFLGCPQIAFLQLKDMTDILEETKKMLEQKVAEESGSQQGEQDATDAPVSTTNPSEEVTELKEGTVDVLTGVFRGEEINWITSVNSNGELEGNTITSQFVSDGNYHYLGIHGDNVSVGGQSDSDASKSLRRAMAILFTGAKSVLREQDGFGVQLSSYPLATESWVSPAGEQDEYLNIFEKNASGEALYSSKDGTKNRMKTATEEALKALQQAGYTVTGGKVTQAPKGASMTFHLWLANGKEHPLYAMAAQVAETFRLIGIQLQIDTIESEALLQKKLATGKQQLWIGKRGISDVDLQGRYASRGANNIFGIQEGELDKNLELLQTCLTSAQRRGIYQKCVDEVLEWGVEVPVCEYQNTLMFSSSRVKSDSIPKDVTSYYDWMNEVQKIEMK